MYLFTEYTHVLSRKHDARVHHIVRAHIYIDKERKAKREEKEEEEEEKEQQQSTREWKNEIKCIVRD